MEMKEARELRSGEPENAPPTNSEEVIKNLLRGMEAWAAEDEMGIPDVAWDAYVAAKQFVDEEIEEVA